jgi:hypothetical protein
VAQGYDQIDFAPHAARKAILSSWSLAAIWGFALSALSASAVLAVWGVALWVLLLGPVLAQGLAGLYKLRRDWKPESRHWWTLLASLLLAAWVPLAAGACYAITKHLFGASLNVYVTGSALTSLVFGVSFAYAERSPIPLLSMGLTGLGALMAASILKEPLAFLVPAIIHLNAVLLTLAVMNHRVIKSRTRLESRCMRCNYLAHGLKRCPECGGEVNPALGPVAYDPRLDG